MSDYHNEDTASWDARQVREGAEAAGVSSENKSLESVSEPVEKNAEKEILLCVDF